MINRVKLLDLFFQFMQDPILKSLTVECKTFLERTEVRNVLMESPEMKHYKLEYIDERLVMNQNKTKFFIINVVSEQSEPDPISWN